MKVLNVTINDLQQCWTVENKEFISSIVPIIHVDCLEEKFLGPIPLHLSKIFNLFLKVLYCTISPIFIGKRMNCGADNGLEIPVEYKFFGDKRAVAWTETHKKWKRL